jgi:hypothetical protein
MLVAVAIAVMVMVATAALGGQIVGRARARAAADAAALAGVDGGRPAAARLAALNGASLVSFSVDGEGVTVVVAIGDVHVTARASDLP